MWVDIRALHHPPLQELTRQLDDRKQANVMLNAENQRLKRQLSALQQRLTDIEAGRFTMRGEAAGMAMLRAQVCGRREQAGSGQLNGAACALSW